jgi:hypothetical protein
MTPRRAVRDHIPWVVWVSLASWIVLLVSAFLACRLHRGDQPAASHEKLLEVLIDSFKVGLGAFIAMLAQWANTVFTERRSRSARGADEPEATDSKQRAEEGR